MYDLLHGTDIILASFKNARGRASSKAASADGAPEPLISVPLEIIVHVVQATLLLPASSR